MALETSKLSLSTLSTTDGHSVGSSNSVQLISVSCLNVSSLPPMSPLCRGAPLLGVPEVAVLSTSTSCPALASVSASVSATEKQLCPLPTEASGDSDGGISGGLRECLVASFSQGAHQRYVRGLLENWRLVVAYTTPFVLLPWPLALRQPVRVLTTDNGPQRLYEYIIILHLYDYTARVCAVYSYK